MGLLFLTFFMALGGLLQDRQLAVTQRVEPQYPALARAARVERDIRLSVEVNPDGSVRDVKVVEGHPLFNEAAIEAVKQWKYAATFTGGSANVTLAFKLPKEPDASAITGKIVDTEGRPLSGVQVSARTLGYSRGLKSWSVGVLGAAKTDVEGMYRITRVVPGDYYVLARNAGPQFAPRTFYPGSTDPLAAVPVNVTLTADAVADIRVPRMETFSVTGTITIPPLSLTPRGPIDVRLMRFDPEFAPEDIVGQTIKLDDKTSDYPLDLRGVSPGRYELRAVFSVGPPNWAYSAAIPVEVRDKSIENLVVNVVRNTEFKGRVVSSVPSLKLETLLVGLMAPADGGFFPVSVDGSVRLFNLPEARHNVQVRGLVDDAYVSDVKLGSISIYAEGIVPVTSARMEDLEVFIKANGGSLSGSVQNALKEAAAATVYLVPEGARRQNSMFYRDVKTTPVGAFQIRGIPAGEYKLFAFEAAPPFGALENADFVARHEQRGLRVTVREGTTLPSLAIQVIPKNN